MSPEPREDSVHFLVLTDVCGNRTYGVVAQFYRPMNVSGHAHALGLGCFPVVRCTGRNHRHSHLLKVCHSVALGTFREALWGLLT